MPLRILLTRKSPAFLSAAALLFLLGSSSAASATVAAPDVRLAASHPSALRPAATTVTWHRLTLQNGWKSARSNSLDVANPSYAISGGMVYLDGALRQPVGSSTQFGVLPAGYRPSHTLYFAVYTGANGVAGSLRINPTGTLQAFNGAARDLTSLAAISFPVSGMTWHALTLKNGWVSSQQQWKTGNPAYAVKSGIVHLAGSLHLPSGGNTMFGVLPKGARPAHALYLIVYNFNGATGTVRIRPDGRLNAYGPAAVSLVSLAGISFPNAAFAWKKLVLEDGWTSSQTAYGTGDPSYATVGPIVYLTGSMHQASGTSPVSGNLPQAARTPNGLLFLTYTLAGSYGSILVARSFLVIGSTPASNAQNFTSLAAISYPRNS